MKISMYKKSSFPKAYHLEQYWAKTILYFCYSGQYFAKFLITSFNSSNKVSTFLKSLCLIWKKCRDASQKRKKDHHLTDFREPIGKILLRLRALIRFSCRGRRLFSLLSLGNCGPEITLPFTCFVWRVKALYWTFIE